MTGTEVERKTKEVADAFKKDMRLVALLPKFQRALLASPFASYGALRKIAELEDEHSDYSQFVKGFLESHKLNN